MITDYPSWLLDSEGVPILDIPAKYLLPDGPDTPTALYRWYDSEGLLLYVGISSDAANREEAHRRRSSWVDFAVRTAVCEYNRRELALWAERVAIDSEQPLFNRVHNDTPEARLRAVKYLVAKGRLDLLAPVVSRG